MHRQGGTAAGSFQPYRSNWRWQDALQSGFCPAPCGTSRQEKRVVYAIPYTSIIEQTAEIFRGIFGVANVIEHHCNVESDPSGETTRSRLACENWDAPLVVTTNVQLLESLFARKTSRCRKLHNLCNSVVILDEAQLLPVPYLQPVIDVLRLLVKDYGVTLVLYTATQPALDSRISFDMARQLRGFLPEEIVEIVDDVASLYAALERVRVHLPADLKAPQAWVDLGDEVSAHNAVLTVVSRRADARELYARIKEQSPAGLWHLSGLMCAQHRSNTIAAIKGGPVGSARRADGGSPSDSGTGRQHTTGRSRGSTSISRWFFALSPAWIPLPRLRRDAIGKVGWQGVMCTFSCRRNLRRRACCDRPNKRRARCGARLLRAHHPWLAERFPNISVVSTATLSWTKRESSSCFV